MKYRASAWQWLSNFFENAFVSRVNRRIPNLIVSIPRDPVPEWEGDYASLLERIEELCRGKNSFEHEIQKLSALLSDIPAADRLDIDTLELFSKTLRVTFDQIETVSAKRRLLGHAVRIFAVGDDWQAIYRFAGSDIAIMREFQERFGASERIDLGTTFRCSEPIASAATKFVLQNRAQLRKNVSATRQLDGPGLHIGLPDEDGTDLLADALQQIEMEVSERGENASVLILGRYQFRRPKNFGLLERTHPKLNLSYKTVHSSKGLEADYVVVVGICSGKYGFPAEISDDPVLDIVLAAPEAHSNAEERRLLYVAVTRARRRAFLLAEEDVPSPFIKEILEGGYDVSVFGGLPEKEVACPTCVEGRLKRRQGEFGPFYSCSNWPYCDYKPVSCSHCSEGIIVKSDDGFICRDCGCWHEACPMSDCEGWLQKKSGKHGMFYGCTNWPICNYTKNSTD